MENSPKTHAREEKKPPVIIIIIMIIAEKTKRQLQVSKQDHISFVATFIQSVVRVQLVTNARVQLGVTFLLTSSALGKPDVRTVILA